VNESRRADLRQSTSSQTPIPAPDRDGQEVEHDAGAEHGLLRPPGEGIPRLSKPSGAPARNLPSWDLEPPAFLIKRGEDA
jgi:hypothetical protein